MSSLRDAAGVLKNLSESAPKSIAQTHSLQRRVSLLSFMDCFRVIAWLTLAAIPLLLLDPALHTCRAATGSSLRTQE